MKKYKLTKKSITNIFGIKLFQIQATVSFGLVVKGELGGYIESEKNLSQVSGNAWVYGDARVYGKIKCKVGFYFGFLYKGEKIKKIKSEDGILLRK